MNFEHMPELSWEWGYVVVWTIIGIIVITEILLMWKAGMLKQVMSGTD